MVKLTGTKLNMTQIWKDDAVVPVTVIRLDTLNDITALQEGALVKVSGISKGKGFQGVVKRHGFHGGPKSHGQKNRLRAPGSIGATAPQRVIPGMRMAGRMGGVRITTRNLKVVEIKSDAKHIFLRGAVPGNKRSKVEIYSSDTKTANTRK